VAWWLAGHFGSARFCKCDMLGLSKNEMPQKISWLVNCHHFESFTICYTVIPNSLNHFESIFKMIRFFKHCKLGYALFLDKAT
jgi:hypothetical protein